MTITAAPASNAVLMHGIDARIRVFLGDAARGVQRHIEVGADEDALAPGCARSHDLVETQDLHAAAISATVVSSMRFEKPHSLSYQASTFTSRPSCDTRVCVASKVLEAGSWLKSTLTSGAVL